MKKTLLVWICSAVCVGINLVATERSALSSISKNSSNEMTRKGIKLVNLVWKNISNGRLHSLEEMMSKDFISVGYLGDVDKRTGTMKILQNFHKQHLRASPIKKAITFFKNDVLVVYYSVQVTFDGISSPLWVSQESLFRKKHGKWIWIEQADALVNPNLSSGS